MERIRYGRDRIVIGVKTVAMQILFYKQGGGLCCVCRTLSRTTGLTLDWFVSHKSREIDPRDLRRTQYVVH